MSRVIGMAGPINIGAFREFIDPTYWNDSLPNGQGGQPVNLLCRELLKRGRKLVILTCDAAAKEEIVLEGPNLRLCIGPKGIRPARDFFRTERDFLARALAREGPDVVHAQWTYEYAMPVQSSGIPYLVTAHDAPIRVLRHNFIPYRMARTLMAYRVTSRARRIVSVSPYISMHLRKYMLYRGTLEVVPNGLPDDFFDVGTKGQRDRGEVVFACVLVGWGGLKNGRVAIEAFSRTRKAHPRARLLLFGAGHGPGEEAQKWSAENGVAEGIEFVGQQPYRQVLARLASEVDVLVHPSLEEAHGMAVIEAMAMRVPVIGGRQSGAVPWTLDHGRAGVLVDVTSPSSVSDAMIRLADEPLLRVKLGALGHASAKARFHISHVASSYEKLYDEIAEKR